MRYTGVLTSPHHTMSVRRFQLSRQRGAALLLLIAALGMGAALLLMSAFSAQSTQRLRQLQTQQTLAEAREALIGFATQNGRLPRPARSSQDGTESPIACDSPRDCTGLLPWVTLGLNGADGWGKLLHYSVTPSFTKVPIQATTVGGDKTIMGRDYRGIAYYIVGQQDCPLYAQCAPAVIYASGEYGPGISIQGIVQPGYAINNIDERQNDISSSNFISRPLSSDPQAPGGEFDDLVTWLPTQLLYDRMRAAKTLR